MDPNEKRPHNPEQCEFLSGKDQLMSEVRLLVTTAVDIREKILLNNIREMNRQQDEANMKRLDQIDGRIDGLYGKLDHLSNGWTKEFIQKQQAVLEKTIEAKLQAEKDERDIKKASQERRWGRLDKWLDFLLKGAAVGGIIYLAVEALIRKIG